MAKNKFDWAPFLEAYKALPEDRRIYEKDFRSGDTSIETYCQRLEKSDKRTPLHFAAECGLEEPCLHYINGGIDINVKDSYNETPLYFAVIKKHIGLCKTLLQLGADPLIANKHQGKTPFHYAAPWDELSVLFLDVNADVNVASNISFFKGKTPFLSAAQCASPDVLQRFIKQGGDLWHLDCDGNSVLHEAASTQGIEKCKLLLDAGADLYNIGKQGKTVLHEAAYTWCKEREKLEPMLRFLIVDKGMLVDIRDKQERTPLHYAANICNPLAAEILVEFGADINARNKNKQTALHVALKPYLGGDIKEICEFLVRVGIDPRIKDSKGKTALDIAREGADWQKVMVESLEKAMKEWEGKPETVAKKPGKAAETKPAKKKATGVVPLKKEITLPTIFNLNLKPDLSLSTKLDQLHEMLGTTLPDYDEFVTKYGIGIVNYSIRVYPPDQVIKELPEFRERWSEYFLWDDEDSKLDEDDLARSTPLADSIEGDEFVYYPGSDEDKSKKKGFYVLPRNEYSIKYVGKDLGDVFKFARKLFSDFPKDNLFFEGYNDISYQEYTVSELSKSFDDMAKALRKTGKYDHEMMVKGKYLTLCSMKLGGIVDFDFEGKKVFIRCNKDSDTSKIHDALLKLGLEQTVKDKLLYQG